MSVNTELLKNKDFRNTLFAIGANQLSDSMSYITTPIIILALTGSPEAASITLFVAGVLATFAGAVSGTWVDRIGPSKCLALSCIGQSLSWIATLLYLVFNVTNIYVLVITISLAAIISTFDYPSEQSIIARVVPKEHLGYASGMGETRESTANLLGGPVAGIIIGFSTVLMTAVHAVPRGVTSLAIVAACSLLLPVVHSMLWAVCLLIVLAGVVLPSFNSSIIAYINASTPEHMIGRVHSVQGIPNMALTPLAVLLAGFLIVDWGITYTALFYAVFIFLSLVVMVFQKPLRQLPHISQVPNAQ